MAIEVREINSHNEFTLAEDIQISAWGMSERMVTPKEIMLAIQHNGGLVLGAFDGNKMVGVSIAFLGMRDGKLFMYSHQTGVSKEYQDRGVGYMLKQKQREICLERGIDLIAWTFDPLIARNAYLNLNKLGGIARNYLTNYYGTMNDSINFGWQTDRVICEWYIEEKMHKMIRYHAITDTSGALEAIVKSGEWPYIKCIDWVIDKNASKVLIDIPYDITEIKRKDMSEAIRWREGIRDVFQRYFENGLVAVSLLRKSNELKYLLTKVNLPRNIFYHIRA